MKTILHLTVVAALGSGLALFAIENPTPAGRAPEVAAKSAAPAPKSRAIEVCFVLDTTGSMTGLIEGAKQKIWSIANDIIAAKPKPEVRFAVIGYRDRGDEYVTKRVDLTSDMDAFYARLKEFRAQGGGDTPESVSEALHEAVTKISWTPEPSVFRVIYLVGDAPPQKYQDGKDWPKVCKKAGNKDIIINTIQCGNIAGTMEVWKAIASQASGAFAQIPQDGNMVQITAPQDAELQRLNADIGRTLIPCGSAETRADVAAKQERSEALAPGSAAGRLMYNKNTGVSVQGGGELIDDLAKGKKKLDEVPRDQLPENLRKMSADELKAHVAQQTAKRAEVQGRIDQLLKERDAWLQQERQRRAAEGEADSFDEEVATTMRTQAARKGFAF